MTKKLTPEQKLQRKPITRACVFCHEKHLQCDVGRPCQNCLKRGIGDQCRDKERKPRKRGPRKVKKEGAEGCTSCKKSPHVMDRNAVMATIQQQLVPVINTATLAAGAASSKKYPKVLKPKPVVAASKKQRISKLAMDTLSLPMPAPASNLEIMSKQKKMLSPELPKIPSLTQLFNPTVDQINSPSVLPAHQNADNASGSQFPSLVDKIPLESKENSTESQKQQQQKSLAYHPNHLHQMRLADDQSVQPGPQVSDKSKSTHYNASPVDQALPQTQPQTQSKLQNEQPLAMDLERISAPVDSENIAQASENSSTGAPGEFGSIWTTEEYTKLNDMLSTPTLSRNTSKTYLNANIAWSPTSIMKMDTINETSNATNDNHELLSVGADTLKRTNSRPYISLDQMINDSKRDSNTDTSPESQSSENPENMSPFKFRQLVKTPEDLYQHQNSIHPHNYKAAYMELLKFLRFRFLHDDKKQGDGPMQLQNIAHSIKTHYAPIFVTLTTNLIAQDLKLQEIILQRSLLEYESMAKLVNCTPMCIWRRSGEICFASNEFISLTGFTKKEILNTRKFIMEFMDNESIVEYYDIFHENLAFGSTQSDLFNSSTGTSDGQAIFSECNLLLKNGCYLRCACIWTVKRDGFNIPMLIMGQFLPIFDIV